MGTTSKSCKSLLNYRILVSLSFQIDKLLVNIINNKKKTYSSKILGMAMDPLKTSQSRPRVIKELLLYINKNMPVS